MMTLGGAWTVFCMHEQHRKQAHKLYFYFPYIAVADRETDRQTVRQTGKNKTKSKQNRQAKPSPSFTFFVSPPNPIALGLDFHFHDLTYSSRGPL
jgi:hypothetical protein